MSAIEPGSGVSMELDDSGCVQDECSPSKSELVGEVYTRKPQLLDLPDEVLFYILKYCTPHSLKALGFTCARFGALVLERSLWNYVDARDVCTSRARMRWMVQNFHVGTHAVLLHGHANEARGCRGHVNRTRKEAEEDKPRDLSCRLGGFPQNIAEVLQEPEPVVELVGNGDAENGDGDEAPYPLQRQHARLHINALNSQHLPSHPDWSGRQRGSPTWPEDCEWDDEEEPPQESSEDTAGCGGPVFTLSADIVRELCIRCPRLYELNLEYCNINCNKINLSSFPTALRRLSLKGTRCYNPPLDKSYLFRIHDYLPVLEHLDLSECAWLEPAALLPLSKMVHLQVLLMRECPAMAEFVAYVSLATRYGFRRLKVLDMRGSPVGDSEVSALGWLPELEELYLSAPPASSSSAARSPAPHHHYIGDPLPRRSQLDPWETQIPPYYTSRGDGCEGRDSPDVGEDLEAQLSALQAMPPLSIEVRTRLRLPSRNQNSLNQPQIEPNLPPHRPSTTQRRKHSEDTPGPHHKRTKRDSGNKDCEDDTDTDDEDDDDDDRDNSREMDTTDDRDDSVSENVDKDIAEDGAGSQSDKDGSPDKTKKSSDDESKSRYRIFKHKNTFDDMAGPSNDNSEEERNSKSRSNSKSPEKCPTRRYVYKMNYGPLSNENDDGKESDKPEQPITPSNNEEDDTTCKIHVNEGASSSNVNTEMEVNEEDKSSIDNTIINVNEVFRVKDNTEEAQNSESTEEETDRVKEGKEEKPKTEKNGVEECEKQKTEPIDAKTEECSVNEGASGSRDTKEGSREDRPEGSAEKMEESSEPNAEPSSASGSSNTYRCQIDVQDGASTSRYSIRVQVMNELLHDGTEQRGQGDANEQADAAAPAEREGSPASAELPPPPVQRCVRFRRNQPPVVLHVPGDQNAREPLEQQASPRHHVLYVNLGQQLHAVYRLLPHRAATPPPHRAPQDHLDANSLVSDASIRRFGRADGENINIVNIGPDGPQFGARDTSGRPNRSSLRILSATGYRNITNRSLVHLASAAPHLQTIDFTNTGVTVEGVETFKSMRPEVQVTYSEFTSEDDIEE